jgi:cell division protein FtsI/penicillin-binding protein 2
VPNLAPRRRLVPAAAVLFFAGACVLARLTFLQVLRHGYYAERAEVNQQERVPLPPARGEIRDRRGNLLAQDRRTYSLIAVPRNMPDPARMARRLARALDLDEKRLAAEFKRRPNYCWVVRQRPPELAAMFADSTKGKTGWQSVFLQGETRRSYPKASRWRSWSGAPTSTTSASRGSSTSSTRSCAGSRAGAPCCRTAGDARSACRDGRARTRSTATRST